MHSPSTNTFFHTQDFRVDEPFTVQLTVYNRGDGIAEKIGVLDDSWKSDKFRLVDGSTNFSIEMLDPGEEYSHQFVVAAKKKIYFHRVRPAKLVLIEGEKSFVHQSNTLPDMKVTNSDDLAETLLFVGRIATLNIIKTKRGWMVVAGIALVLFLLQFKRWGTKFLQARRHTRALKSTKKMR